MMICLHLARRFADGLTIPRQIISNTCTSGLTNQMNHISTSAPLRPALNGTVAVLDDRFLTAGIIVIGDEILKGQTQDTNSSFLAKRLFSIGVRVKKISVIGDDLDTIAKEVREFSERFTHVLTSGGIGPTHDDLTVEGVARAFGKPVVAHPEMMKLCKEYFGTDDLKSPKLKLAYVPESSQLCYGIDKKTGAPGKFPVVKINNVYIFPGIPRLLTSAFERLEENFRNPSAEFVTEEIYISVDEASVTGVLNEVNDRFKDRVILGSYPELHNSYYKVKLSLEAKHRSEIEEICTVLRERLPQGSVVNYDSEPVLNAGEKVYTLSEGCVADGEFCARLKRSLSTVEQALERYSIERGEIAIGFNGGKDCTALLHLVHAVTRRSVNPPSRLLALYIRHGQPFPETELFVTRCKELYNMEFINVSGRIKEALAGLKTSHPNLKAVFMGTRLTDPHANNLEAFSPTDLGWPEYMRVNPLLEWTYADLWTFIRTLSLPYCSLYDRGYTSLGSIENTHPNPQLRVVDARGNVTYRPAYTLISEQLERAGRNPTKL